MYLAIVKEVFGYVIDGHSCFLAMSEELECNMKHVIICAYLYKLCV